MVDSHQLVSPALQICFVHHLSYPSVTISINLCPSHCWTNGLVYLGITKPKLNTLFYTLIPPSSGFPKALERDTHIKCRKTPHTDLTWRSSSVVRNLLTQLFVTAHCSRLRSISLWYPGTALWDQYVDFSLSVLLRIFRCAIYIINNKSINYL